VRSVLRALALLIAFRGVGNLLKRFGTGSGLVVFGHLLPQDTLLAPGLGTLMLIYAYGLWREAGWAAPLGIAYALFASANLILFPVFTPMPQIPLWLYGIYVVGGIAMTWGAVWLLLRVRAGR
jgi:hypothetical protein